MELSQNDFRLAGDHFICNIALDENLPGGLINVARDPRKLKAKPDAYVAKVEKVGPGCKNIKLGDKIVVERFSWLQYDIDDERIIAREVDVLILDNDSPAPGVAVLKEITERERLEARSSLFIPDSSYSESSKREYIFGRITHSGVDYLKPGNFAWILKTESNQWRLRKDVVVFRPDENMVPLIAEKQPVEFYVA